MNLLVDGEIFLFQNYGGISRLCRQILGRIGRLAPDVKVVLATQRRIDGFEFVAESVRLEFPPRLPANLKPWRLWKNIAPPVNSFAAMCYWMSRSANVFLPTYYTMRGVHAPMVCFVYDMIYEKFPDIFCECEGDLVRRKKKAALEGSDLVLCISRKTKKDVTEILNIPESKCRLIYPGGLTNGMMVCLDQETADEQRFAGRFLLYVGDYTTAYKNFDFVVRNLASEGFRSFSDLNLVVVSAHHPETPKPDQWRRLMGDRLVLVGNCDDSQLVGLYRDCEALIYPSLYEGFGIPIVEALGLGAPVVCSNSGALPEAGGEAAYYFDPRSRSEFKSALERALSDGRRRDLVEKRKRQASHFSWDTMAMQFVQACRDVCE